MMSSISYIDKLPTPDELQRAWEEVAELHQKHLLRYEVKIPSAETYAAVAKSIWLAMLHHFSDEHVHKNLISSACMRDNPRLGRDQPVRHLKRDGWRLESDGKGNYRLDPYRCSTERLDELAWRAGRLSAASFQDLKILYGNRCAICAARDGLPDSRYGAELVRLRRARKNPEESGNDLANIIPRCQFCHDEYQDHFVFDDKGKVVTVASTVAIQRASKEVQLQILAWAKEKARN